MPDPMMLDQDQVSGPESQTAPDSDVSFGDILSAYEQSQAQGPEEGQGIAATVVTLTPDHAVLDVGKKTEGVIPIADLPRDAAGELDVKPGDTLQVSIKGRNSEGYYQLSLIKVERPRDWSGLEKAFADKSPIGGVVTAVVKGGLSVDVGVRAFMPASRSGARDAAEMEKLIGQDIKCRIIKLDTASEDVVVDRRAVLEEEEARAKEQRFSELQEGAVLHGIVRTLMDYGAFVDIGGFDGLLHVADISWSRVNKPADVLSVGQEVDVQVLKVDPKKRRVSLGLKQLTPHPWDGVAERYQVGEKVSGTVTRVADFGAFVELEPGVEGLIHFSEMSWSKKVRKPSDVVQPGDAVEVVILSVNPAERRIGLGLKQALGDPWAEAARKWPAGSVVEGTVVSLQKFGAFVQLAEGVEGMIHVGDISAEKRINHPQEVLKMGETVRAKVLEIDLARRRMRLGLKQLVPTSLDEYIAERKAGDVVTGRVVDVRGNRARVELGEGVTGFCSLEKQSRETAAPETSASLDVSALSSMLAAKWKGEAGAPAGGEGLRAGQIRSFRIASLDPAQKRIDLELEG